MRLIDAEHLKWNVGGIKCGEITVEYLLWIIDHQEPTIEAIPVEWIRKHLDTLCEERDQYEVMSPHWNITNDVMMSIVCMIGEWEQERRNVHQ